MKDNWKEKLISLIIGDMYEGGDTEKAVEFVEEVLTTQNKSFIEIIDTKHQEILNKRKYLETKRPNIVIDEISEMFDDIKAELEKEDR